MTLHDAFGELIKKRKWYINSLRSPIQAKNDKASFLRGKKLPEERIREYLSSGGYICVKLEEWEKLKN